MPAFSHAFRPGTFLVEITHPKFVVSWFSTNKTKKSLCLLLAHVFTPLVSWCSTCGISALIYECNNTWKWNWVINLAISPPQPLDVESNCKRRVMLYFPIGICIFHCLRFVNNLPLRYFKTRFGIATKANAFTIWRRLISPVWN